MSEEMNPSGLPEELREVEAMLSGLTPAAAGLDRDQVMYEAGRAGAVRAGRAKLRVWQGTCAGLVLACVGLTLFAPLGGGGRKVANMDATGGTGLPPGIESRKEGVKPVAATDATMAVAPADDPRLSMGLLRLQRGALGEQLWVRPDRAGGGSANMPALLPGDGWNSLPAWQKRAAMTGGNKS